MPSHKRKYFEYLYFLCFPTTLFGQLNMKKGFVKPGLQTLFERDCEFKWLFNSQFRRSSEIQDTKRFL